MTFSLADIYGGRSGQLPTSSQTIPEAEEEKYYDDNTVDNEVGQKAIVNKSLIWGSLLLIVGVMALIHFIE